METGARQATPPVRTESELIAALARDPFRFDFFRLARLLETVYRDLPRFGNADRPEDERVRFSQNPSLAFAPSSIEAFVPGEGGDPHRLFVRFLGLLGPNAPLPLHLTEFARGRELHNGDRALIRFLDIFNHRVIALFYKAWASAQKTADFDRPEESRFAMYIGSLIGMGMPSLFNRDSVPDRAKLFFAGRLAAQVRNAEGLAAILGDFFQIPAAIEEFHGFWMTLPEDSHCRLGESPETGSLGVSTIMGTRVRDAQLKFRIRLGPMTLASMKRLLPGGKAFRQIKDWVRLYAGEEYFWDLQLVLLAREVPDSRLGSSGRLGLDCWLKSKPFTDDCGEAIFEPICYS